MYNVACGEALTGHGEEALQLLHTLVARKLDLGAETDADSAGIRGGPKWAAFVSELATMRQPIVKSTVAFRLDDPTLIATGIAIDPQNDDVFVASVRHRKMSGARRREWCRTSSARGRMASSPAPRSPSMRRVACSSPAPQRRR
jgi:hypothetical protein